VTWEKSDLLKKFGNACIRAIYGPLRCCNELKEQMFSQEVMTDVLSSSKSHHRWTSI